MTTTTKPTINTTQPHDATPDLSTLPPLPLSPAPHSKQQQPQQHIQQHPQTTTTTPAHLNQPSTPKPPQRRNLRLVEKDTSKQVEKEPVELDKRDIETEEDDGSGSEKEEEQATTQPATVEGGDAGEDSLTSATKDTPATQKDASSDLDSESSSPPSPKIPTNTLATLEDKPVATTAKADVPDTKKTNVETIENVTPENEARSKDARDDDDNDDKNLGEGDGEVGDEKGEENAMLAQLEAMNRDLMNDVKATHSIKRSDTMEFERRVRSSLDFAQRQEDGGEDEIDWDFWSEAVADFDAVSKKNPKALTTHVEAGIPPALRGLAWQLMARSKNPVLESDYAFLLKTESPHDKYILRDLARTFPRHDHFRDREGDGQTGLFNVIRAYSILDPEVGYCQGLTFVVGPLLLNMPDEEAFCLLVALLKSPGTYELRGQYTPAMQGLQLRLYQFDRLLEETLPDLSGHLISLGVKSTVYASQWFMTLFAYNLPMPLVLRIYDVIISEGSPALLRFALAILKRAESHILTLDFERTMDYLKTDLASPYRGRPRQLITDAAAVREVTAKKLEKLAKDHANEMKKVAARGGDTDLMSPAGHQPLGNGNGSSNGGSGASTPSYSATLASYFFSKVPRRSDTTGSSTTNGGSLVSENADGWLAVAPGTPTASDATPFSDDVAATTVPPGSPTSDRDPGSDAAAVGHLQSRLRRLENDRSRLDRALVDTSRKHLAAANDLVATRLALARERDLTEALRRQVRDLKSLLSAASNTTTNTSSSDASTADGDGGGEPAPRVLTSLERRDAALERRAEIAEAHASKVETELVASKLAFAESEDRRLQMERKWNDLKKAMR